MIDTNDRPGMQEYFLSNMAQVLTREQFSKAKALLDEMPDNIFWQMMLEAAARTPEPNGIKDRTNLLRKARAANGVTPKNTALNDLMMKALSDEESDEVWSHIAASYPSDVIKLTGEQDSQLIKLWEKSTENVTIPSDLFFAGTIPLMDCRIVVDETKSTVNGKVVSYRVVIFADYEEQLRAAEPDMPINVGAIVNDPIQGAYSFIPFFIVKGVDSLMFYNVGYRNLPQKYIQHAEQTITIQDVSQICVSFLETWYGIQIALLHPNVRDVFRHPRTTIDKISSIGSGGKRKNRVKYIKEHIINSADLEMAIFGGDKSHTRHALVWYVIGHWREYVNGVKTFVKPYWKGPLREMKMTLEDRTREIDGIDKGGCVHA